MYSISVLQGEGVGPEVIGSTMEVLGALAPALGLHFEIDYGPDASMNGIDSVPSLTPEVAAFFDASFSGGRPVLCGPVGGRFVYDLRQHYDLFYKLAPLRPFHGCGDLGPLRPDYADDADVLIVRENMSGLYFGEWGHAMVDGTEQAYHRFCYRRPEVERVIRIGVRYALQRYRKLHVVVKTGGIPAISSLWRDVLAREARDQAIETGVLEIDNAAYQLISAPESFDVIVAPNMFGDVLADCGALLIGARGMSYSGNFDGNGRSVYQTGHGAAHDITGRDIANPVGQIMSLAMLLRESLGLDKAAARIEAAVATALAAGWRTPDIAARGSRIVGTRELGARIAEAVAGKSLIAEAG